MTIKKMTIKKIETWPKPKICRNPEHNPPSHMVLEPGLYSHTCPGCGKVQVFTVQENYL
jgi:hypothetical protein